MLIKMEEKRKRLLSERIKANRADGTSRFSSFGGLALEDESEEDTQENTVALSRPVT